MNLYTEKETLTPAAKKALKKIQEAGQPLDSFAAFGHIKTYHNKVRVQEQLIQQGFIRTDTSHWKSRSEGGVYKFAAA